MTTTKIFAQYFISPIYNCFLPIISQHDYYQDKKNEDHPKAETADDRHDRPFGVSNNASNVPRRKRRLARAPTVALIAVCVLGPRYILECMYDTLLKPSDSTLYGPLLSSSPKHNITSQFVATFEEMLLTERGITVGHGNLVPLILDVDNRKLLCRRGHKRKLSWFRSRLLMNMVRMGLQAPLRNSGKFKALRINQSTKLNTKTSLPILISDGDAIYCNIAVREDTYSFPRLGWSTLSPARQTDNHNNNWCHVIGLPSYETWWYLHRKYKQESDWLRQFRSNEQRYPWHEKLNLAVWRGSTTYEGSLYGDKPLEETPRGQLVKLSMGRPDLIDAGFTKINQKFATEKKALIKETRVVSGIWMNDMMKYKAIIDIDGNNWSSRFGMLLCMNSVVIKIEPDFIEYFYKDLQPMVHYIPASLHNLTQTTQYVMDEASEKEIKTIVQNANSWCQKTLIEPKFAEDAMEQLEIYQNALNEIEIGWRKDWEKVMNHFTSTIDDLVECDVKNIASFLID